MHCKFVRLLSVRNPSNVRRGDIRKTTEQAASSIIAITSELIIPRKPWIQNAMAPNMSVSSDEVEVPIFVDS